MNLVPVVIAPDQTIKLSARQHSELIKQIIEQFAPRFVPGGRLVYVGDTGDRSGYFDKDLLASLSVSVDQHGKMPDAIIYYEDKEWLILAEAVTSHGPVDAKRHEELAILFKDAAPHLVYVSTFPNRRMFAKDIEAISWETEVWIADDPTHLIHFNGTRFLGPYEKP
jgi:BsuBI/PstI restriction endonuclease domain